MPVLLWWLNILNTLLVLKPLCPNLYNGAIMVKEKTEHAQYLVNIW